MTSLLDDVGDDQVGVNIARVLVKNKDDRIVLAEIVEGVFDLKQGHIFNQ